MLPDKRSPTGVRPVTYNHKVSLPFGAFRKHWHETPSHKGVDFACPVGTPVRAFDGGRVEFAGNKGDGFGNYIRILHYNGFKTFYCHLDEMFALPCTRVERGAFIASTGNTGNTTGPHIHFELRDMNGVSINPRFESETIPMEIIKQ